MDAGWRHREDPRTPGLWCLGASADGSGTKEGLGPHQGGFQTMHGLYEGRAHQGSTPWIAMINDKCVAGWQELPMPAMPMCSAWNRILAEPPGSDIYLDLERAFHAGARWKAWPVLAVMQGWLAYAEVELTRVDLADLLGAGVEPSVTQLAAVIAHGGLPVDLVEDEPEFDGTGVRSGKIRIGRREHLGELWDLTTLQDAYYQVLPEPLAAHQCAALDRYRDVSVADFARHPGVLATAEWAVNGLIIGHPPGQTAAELAATLCATRPGLFSSSAIGPALLRAYIF